MTPDQLVQGWHIARPGHLTLAEITAVRGLPREYAIGLLLGLAETSDDRAVRPQVVRNALRRIIDLHRRAQDVTAPAMPVVPDVTAPAMPVVHLAPSVTADGAQTDARCAACGIPAGSGLDETTAAEWEQDIDTHGACTRCLDAISEGMR